MNGNSMAVMAWKNIWRNRRRTAITLSGIAFGVLLAIIFTGIGDSSYGDWIDLSARIGSGHVTFQHTDYLETPSLKKTVEGADELRDLALTDPKVENSVIRINGHVMLATASQNAGAGFIAFDPAKENADTLAVYDTVVEGAMFETSKDKGIILGAKLSENLGAGLGKKVVYTMTDKSGEIVSGLARVTGIVKTGAPSVDGGLCLLPIGKVRKFIGFENNEATAVAVFVKDQRDSQAVSKRLGKLIAQGSSTPKVSSYMWSEINPELAGIISMKISSATFFEIVIMLLVAAGIFNTLFVSVMERMREFGIMMAIGFNPGKLFSLVMWESLWLALVGIVTAAIVTAWPYYYLFTSGIDMSKTYGEGMEVAGVGLKPIIYAKIYPENAIIIGLVVLVATIVAGIYPAYKAGKVVPVESIKLV